MKTSLYRYAVQTPAGDRVILSHPFNRRLVVVSRGIAGQLAGGETDGIARDVIAELQKAELLVTPETDRLPAKVVIFGYGLHPILESSAVAQVLITRSDSFFHLDEDWREPLLRSLNPNAISLAPHFDCGDRDLAFSAMVRDVTDHATGGKETLLALYGNPVMGSKLTRKLIAECRARNLSHTIVSGSSFLDPLWTSMEIDPMRGFSMFTPSVSLEGLTPAQPALLCAIGYGVDPDQRYEEVVLLMERLFLTYPRKHPVTILSDQAGTIRKTTIELADLPAYYSCIRPGTTSLLLPPLSPFPGNPTHPVK